MCLGNDLDDFSLPLMDITLDSLATLKFRNRIESCFEESTIEFCANVRLSHRCRLSPIQISDSSDSSGPADDGVEKVLTRFYGSPCP